MVLKIWCLVQILPPLTPHYSVRDISDKIHRL